MRSDYIEEAVKKNMGHQGILVLKARGCPDFFDEEELQELRAGRWPWSVAQKLAPKQKAVMEGDGMASPVQKPRPLPVTPVVRPQTDTVVRPQTDTVVRETLRSIRERHDRELKEHIRKRMASGLSRLQLSQELECSEKQLQRLMDG